MTEDAAPRPKPVEAQARLRGGPDDGAVRSITTDDLGYLPGFPHDGRGAYWPTWERDDDRVIYQWLVDSDPWPPTWLAGRWPLWPQIARHVDASGAAAGVFYFIGVDDPNITVDEDGRRRLKS